MSKDKIIIYQETCDGTNLVVIGEGETYETIDEYLEDVFDSVPLGKDADGFYNDYHYGKFKIIRGHFVDLVAKEFVTKFEVTE